MRCGIRCRRSRRRSTRSKPRRRTPRTIRNDLSNASEPTSTNIIEVGPSARREQDYRAVALVPFLSFFFLVKLILWSFVPDKREGSIMHLTDDQFAALIL